MPCKGLRSNDLLSPAYRGVPLWGGLSSNLVFPSG